MLRSAVTTIRSRRAQRWRAVALLAPLLLLTQACDPVPTVPSGTTTTTATPTTTAPPTTTTTVPPTTTTTVAPGPGPAGLTRTDTGLTRVRVTLSSAAQWVAVELNGATIDLSRVVSTTGTLQITSLGGQQIAGNGQGTAVIDLVLRVPSGAATSLSMCKNYLGPASVSVHRRTDGDVLVGSLDNSSTSSDVPPGSCEGAASASMTRADLIGPVRWPARRDPRPLVLANYYPWYDPELLSTIGPDRPTGPADTSDPAQVGEAVDLARSSGVDGFVVEYEGTPAHEAKIDAVLNAADMRPGFQTALMLDFAILQYRPGGLSDTGLNTMLAEMASHAGRPSQLKVAGRPVVFVYAAWRVDPAAWSAAVDRLRAFTGIDPFVITDYGLPGSTGQYAYNTYGLSTPGQLQAWADDRVMMLQERPGLDGQTGPLWVAPVSPGYDDRALGRPQPWYLPRNDGVTYEQSWDAALLSLPDWILVTTWNEYYEDTHVMPGSATGNQALTQTAPRSASFHTTG